MSEKTEQRPRSTFREYFEALLIAALFLGFTNTFVFKTFYIPSGSMEETLLIGDHLFVNRFIYGPQPTRLEKALLPGRQPDRGDIVIFRSVETAGLDLVKRCVAIGGDAVEMIDKQLYINDQRVQDGRFTQHLDPQVYPPHPSLPPQLRRRDNWGPVQVPPDHLFCLGDNRDASHDSRYWGPVPMANVKGRAGMIYWSYGGEVSDGQWRGWVAKIQQLGKTALGFLTETRWSRTFRIPR